MKTTKPYFAHRRNTWFQNTPNRNTDTKSLEHTLSMAPIVAFDMTLHLRHPKHLQVLQLVTLSDKLGTCSASQLEAVLSFGKP